jgi:hypothetical protein
LYEPFDRLNMVGIGKEGEFVEVLAGAVFGLLRSDDAD